MDTVSTIAGSVPEGSALALAARALPDVGLPRLRADGRLVEVGVEDLALGPPQAYRLLRGAGVRATKIEAAELTDATEGWPVGLYLAALSLQEQRRSTLPPIRFTGDDRFVVDYIRSEVLGRLSRERQRFSSPVRRSWIGSTDPSATRSWNGPARLAPSESIERQNLLLVPLDRQRKWYLYDNLFRDVGSTPLGAATRSDPAGWHPARRQRLRGGGHARGGLRACARERGQGPRGGAPPASGPGRVPRGAHRHPPARWLALLGEDAIARNTGLALIASLIAALGGDPVSAERWSNAADDVRSDGPSLHGTASLRSSEAIVHAMMSRGGADAMFRAAEVAVREETSTSPYRAAALGLLGLATMIRGDDEVADSLVRRGVRGGPSDRGDAGRLARPGGAVADRDLPKRRRRGGRPRRARTHRRARCAPGRAHHDRTGARRLGSCGPAGGRPRRGARGTGRCPPSPPDPHVGVPHDRGPDATRARERARGPVRRPRRPNAPGRGRRDPGAPAGSRHADDAGAGAPHAYRVGALRDGLPGPRP